MTQFRCACQRLSEADRMIVVSDAVAEIDRATHEAGHTIMNRIFADVKTTDKVAQMLHSIRS
jgi:hypothetical protein